MGGAEEGHLLLHGSRWTFILFFCVIYFEFGINLSEPQLRSSCTAQTKSEASIGPSRLRMLGKSLLREKKKGKIIRAKERQTPFPK